VTHNYTGYPLVRQARDMVRSGELGEINAGRAFYIQGWLRTRLEAEGQKQASWRTDPQPPGAAGGVGDPGPPPPHPGRCATGLLPAEVSCHLKTFEPGRALDDYGTAVLRYQNGALGTVTASQISHGRENDLWIEIDGTTGALEWHQEETNKLLFRVNGQPHRLYTHDPNAAYMTSTAEASFPLPCRPPQAFFEGFGNINTAAYDAMAARAAGKKAGGRDTLYPNVYDGVDGMNFITQCVASSKENGHWLPLKHPACRS